jgi:hypothetical protein
MGYRPLRRPAGRILIHAEDLDATLNRLLAAADAITDEFPSEVGEAPPEEPPDFTPYLHADLKAVLEDEIVPAVETADGEIREPELQRELIKKALVGLKMPVLRDIARGLGLSGSGASEELATRVAAAYRWNEEEIARLVLDHQEEPTSTEHGFETRVFTFRDEPALEEIVRKLDYVAGRYIRTGVARWYVFEEAVEGDDAVELRGSYRAYKANVEETLEGEPELTSRSSRYSTRLEIGPRRSFVVHGGGATAARSSAAALRLATGFASVRALRGHQSARHERYPPRLPLHARSSLHALPIRHVRRSEPYCRAVQGRRGQGGGIRGEFCSPPKPEGGSIRGRAPSGLGSRVSPASHRLSTARGHVHDGCRAVGARPDDSGNLPDPSRY